MADTVDRPLGNARQLRPGQRTEVWIAGVGAGPAQLVHTNESVLLEAPNWAPDGQGLLLNGDGLLWRLDVSPKAELKQVQIEGLPPINNDHVIDAKRHLIYLSANDGHIYVAPIEGGTAARITHDRSHHHFLHGVSPDGKTLAFVDLPAGDFSAAGRLALISSEGGETSYPEAGSKHLDGPEYPPTAPGSTSTRRSSEAGPATHSSPGCPPTAGPWSSLSCPTPSTGSHISHPTGSTRATSASPLEPSGIRPTSTSRCALCVPRTGARSSHVSPFSGGRGLST
jgi:hypothetical protein